MARPRKHSDEALIAAAARAIGRRGPGSLTLADVAAEAGTVPATLVQRFGSKRDLLLAVASSGSRSVAEAFTAAAERNVSPLAALETALGACAEAVSDPDEAANHLAFLALDLADPDFRVHAAAHADAMRDAVAGLLDSAREAGELAPHAPPELADSVVTAYQGALLLWAIDRRATGVSRVRAAVAALLTPYRR